MYVCNRRQDNKNRQISKVHAIYVYMKEYIISIKSILRGILRGITYDFKRSINSEPYLCDYFIAISM